MVNEKQEEKRVAMGVMDVARELGISRPMAYKVVNRTDFPKIRLGKRIIIPREAFIEWMNGLLVKEGVNE